MNKILIVVWTKAHFKEMSITAAALRGEFAVLVLCSESLKKDEQIRNFCLQNQIEVIYIDDSLSIERIISSYRPNLLTKIVSRFFMQYNLFSFPFHFFNLLKRKRLAKFIIDKIRPNVLILPSLGICEVEDYLNKFSKESNPKIPVVHIPYAWLTSQEQYTAKGNFKVYKRSFLSNIITRRLKRNWNLGQLIYTPLIKLLAIEALGSSVANPWNGEDSVDNIFFESQKMVESFVKDDGNSKKTKVTGAISQDILYQYSKAPPLISTPFLLFAVPANQTGNNMAGFEFASYQEMVFKWIEVLSKQTKYKVVLSIHPREQEIKSLIRRKYDVLIYEDDIYKIFPHCQLFICSITGLIRSAALLNIETIYYDCYHYKLLECPDISNINYAFSFQEFNLLFSKALENPDLRNSRQLHQEWGTLDGNSRTRIKNEIYKLIV